ncbi:MAG: hypothetical protein AAB116_06105 [Candidatus Poribacteria bacterium]
MVSRSTRVFLLGCLVFWAVGLYAVVPVESQAESQKDEKICIKPELRDCILTNLGRYFTEFPSDIASIAVYPFKDGNYKPVMGAIGVTGAVSVFDKPLTQSLYNFQETTTDLGLTEKEFAKKWWYVPGFVLYDSAFTYALPLLHAYGAFSNNFHLYRASYLAIKTWSYSVVVAIPLRMFFKREYPIYDQNHELNNSQYEFFSSSPTGTEYIKGFPLKSFPSFRAAMWFSAADIFANEYDSYFLPYSAATVLTIIGKNTHWVSDIVFGFFTGMGVSRAILNKYAPGKKSSSTEVSWMPYLSQDFYSMNMLVSF